MGHLLLSGTRKSSGKTVVTLGLCAALVARGLRVQPFKKGPDYIDPMWLARAAGRACYNLDFHTSSQAEITTAFAGHAAGADVSLIEGTKGLFDGVAADGSDSNAAMARLLGAPVVLVLDSEGMTRGVAPLLLGYQGFEPQVQIAGVILNRVGGARHESKLRRALSDYTDVPVLGSLPRDEALRIVERHLGLMPSSEDQDAAQRVAAIRAAVARHVDLDALLAAAGRAVPPPARAPAAALPRRSGELSIGVFRDAAFGFYYADDLETLQQAGARLAFIDALHDARLPRVHALFIGGGFPETQLQGLQRNAALRAAVREAIEDGLPTYAECGGLMYLARSLSWRGERAEMAGVIAADVVVGERPQGRGYVELEETADHPWPRPGAGAGALRAHEFHYSRLEKLPAELRFAYRMRRGHGIDGRHDGIVHRNLLASYAHLRHTQHSPWATRFLEFVDARRSKAVEPVGESS